MDTASLLRSIPLFEGLSDDELASLSHGIAVRSFDAGTLIFAKGNVGNAAFVVESGDVNIHLPGIGSSRISLKDIGRGEFFGELALFDDEPRSASALATTDVVLLELSHATLARFLERTPRAAAAILRTMSARLRETNTLLSSRAARNVDEELDKNLSLADRLADAVAALNGSWTFILLILAITAAWCLVNTGLLTTAPFDPYPYQLFNLALAILVGLQGPLIVMSQNRQGWKDRARADADFRVNLKNEVNIETLLRELGKLRAEVTSAASPQTTRT